MAEIVRRDLPVERSVIARDAAVKFFRDQGEHYKAEIIAAIPADEPISLYGQGNFVDLCRGPHVPSTGKLKVFNRITSYNVCYTKLLRRPRLRQRRR